MTILSIDPSLTNTAFVALKVETNGSLLPFGYIMSQSPKSEDKKKLVMEDRIGRIENHFNNLEAAIRMYEPDIITVETSSGSKSSSAAISIGYTLSLIARCRQLCKTITCKPNDVKKFIAANSANKKEVINFVEEMHPNFLPRKTNGDIHLGQAEHIADAVIVAKTCFKKW